MRRLPLLLSVACVVSITACKKTATDKPAPVATTNPSQLISTKEINDFIYAGLNARNEFNWKDASDLMLYSAVMHSDDHMVSVGFKPADEINVDERIATINIHDAKWSAAKQQVLELIYQQEKAIQPQLKPEAVEVWKEDKLPVVDVKIENIQTLQLLRKNNLIRYVEPMGYEPTKFETTQTRDHKPASSGSNGSGCGGYVGNTALQPNLDYTSIQPGTKQSWDYAYHGIGNAWTKSTGSGVKVMVIDTGVSPDQENIGSAFIQGSSTSSRTLQKMYTLPGATNANDNCGHGTTMSSTVGAPRGIDGNSVGVAYDCNLVVCKAANDVIIDGSDEVKGTSDAYTYAADDPTIKITSMSTGRLTSSSQIKDAIVYAYGKGKLMFCAGGTSTSFTTWVGVIFPASLTQVQAITGVKDNATLTACDDCHKGSAIDFVIVMERNSDGGHPIANAISGDVPTTVGGSSVATSTAAGIAALVWSLHPNETRDQIIQRLNSTASLATKKNSNYGYGKLNADLATN